MYVYNEKQLFFALKTKHTHAHADIHSSPVLKLNLADASLYLSPSRSLEEWISGYTNVKRNSLLICPYTVICLPLLYLFCFFFVSFLPPMHRTHTHSLALFHVLLFLYHTSPILPTGSGALTVGRSQRSLAKRDSD